MRKATRVQCSAGSRSAVERDIAGPAGRRATAAELVKLTAAGNEAAAACIRLLARSFWYDYELAQALQAAAGEHGFALPSFSDLASGRREQVPATGWTELLDHDGCGSVPLIAAWYLRTRADDCDPNWLLSALAGGPEVRGDVWTYAGFALTNWLVEALASPEEALRQRVTETLLRLGRGALPALDRAARDYGCPVRESAARLAGTMRAHERTGEAEEDENEFCWPYADLWDPDYIS